MKYSLFLLLILNLFGCGKKDPPSQVQVVNGVETDKHPAIVQISMDYGNGYMGWCTGTFVADDLLITASHCVDEAKSVNVGKTKSIKIFKNPLYSDQRDDWTSQDFATVKFPKNTSKHVLNISTKAIADKDVLLLVGYGLNDYNYDTGTGSSYSKFGVKREATNVYLKNTFLEDGIVAFNGRGKNISGYKGDGTKGSLGQGDSGGPLIIEGKGIIGIASAQGLQGPANGFTNNSYYSYVLSKEAAEFFKKAKAQGMWYESVVDQTPQQPEPQKPQIPDRVEPSKKFDFVGIGEDGIYQIKFSNVPKEVKSIDLYWGFSSSSIFHTESVTSANFETEYAWGFGNDTEIKAVLKDASGKVISELKKKL